MRRTRCRLGARTQTKISPRHSRLSSRTYKPAIAATPPPTGPFFILMETGDHILMETGDKILTEDS